MKLRLCKSELCEYEKRQAPKEEFSPHAQTCNKCKERQAKEGSCEKILYGRWKSIKKRCNNPNSKYYSKPDIVVCKEWADSFKSFYHWAIQSNFEKGLTIERIDNELGYSPENCMWITLSEQTRNKSNVKLNFETAEEIRRAKEKGALTKDIAEFYGVSCSYINAIVKKRYWNKNDAGEKIYEPDEVTQGVKIDAEKAKEIRNLWYTTDKTQKEIGELYGLKGCSVSNILKNIKWVDKGYKEKLSKEILELKKKKIRRIKSQIEYKPMAKKKLNFETAEEIRKKFNQGQTQKALAEEYGVAPKQISRVIKNLVWSPEDYAKQ